MQAKLCKACNRELPLTHFNKSNQTKDGLTLACKGCLYKTRRKRYDETVNCPLSVNANILFSKRKTAVKRKYAIKSQACTITRSEWQTIKERFQHRCAYCQIKPNRLEMDHLLPLSKGGMHTAANVVPACRTCNAKKGNREASELGAVFGTSTPLHSQALISL